MLKRQASIAVRETQATEADSLLSVKSGPVYVGLGGRKAEKFVGFEDHALYGFPIVEGEQAGIRYACTTIDTHNLVPVLSHLHTLSPFSRGPNLDLYLPSNGCQPPANTSITDSSWSSAGPQPRDYSSIDLTPIKPLDVTTSSGSAIGEGRRGWRTCRKVWGLGEEESSWEEGSKVAEMLPEDSLFESKEMYRSTDALIKAGVIKEVPEDASSASSDDLNVSMEPEALVLPTTMAKANHPLFQSIPPKELKDSTVDVSEESLRAALMLEMPNSYSPLLRKAVICEEKHHRRTLSESRPIPRSLLILQSFPCTGYRCTLTLEFSSGSRLSKAVVEEDKEALRLPILLLTPRIIRWTLSNPIAWLSCGFEHAAMVTIEGEVFTWGYGSSGALGHGDLRSYPEPTRLRALSGKGIAYIDCGGYHTAALSESGRLWTWGRGDVYQLGFCASRLVADEFGCYAGWPVEVEDLKRRNRTVKGVACGEAHTLVLCSEGDVWACGWAEDGQLGLPASLLTSEGTMSSQLSQVPGLSRIIKVSAGALFSSAVSSTGEVFTWGNGEQGQLGLGSKTRRTEKPMVVDGLEQVIDVVCGENYALCLTATGKAYGWGSGIAGCFESGQFAHGAALVCYVPRELLSVNIPHLLRVRSSAHRSPQMQSDFLTSLQEELLQLELED